MTGTVAHPTPCRPRRGAKAPVTGTQLQPGPSTPAEPSRAIAVPPRPPAPPAPHSREVRHSLRAGACPLARTATPGTRPLAPPTDAPALLPAASPAGPGSASGLRARDAFPTALPRRPPRRSSPGRPPTHRSGPHDPLEIRRGREGAQGARLTPTRVRGMRSRDDARPSEPLPAGTSRRSDLREGAVHRASGKCSPAAREYAELEARRPTSPACNSARPEALCLTDFWEMSFRGRTRGRMGVRRRSQHAFRSPT